MGSTHAVSPLTSGRKRSGRTLAGEDDHDHEVTTRSDDRYDDLAEGATFADVSQGLGYLVETENAVDVDVDVACDALFGEGLEVRRALPHDKQP